MLNGKLISAKEPIAMALRDGGYKAQDFVFADLLEWSAEVLDLIGSPQSLGKDIACITIKDHRGKLPCNLNQIVQASAMLDNGIQFPMREANNTFHPLFFENGTLVGTLNPQTPIAVDPLTGNATFNFYNYDESLSGKMVNILPLTFKDTTYEVNSDYIYTSFKDGAKVLLSYRSFPIDREGFPLIPDNISYKKAVQHYIMWKLDYQMWRRSKISDKIFEEATQQKDWYVGKATTAAIIPGIDGMESLKNQWLKMYQDFNTHDKFFDNLGDQQFLKMGQNYSRYY